MIRYELEVKAPRQRVWDALTTREGWSAWFSYDVLGEFVQGSVLELDFGPYGQGWVKVVEREDNSVFAYSWHPGECARIDAFPEAELTIVRFELSDTDGGTRIVLTETGFENLPEDRRRNALHLNTDGWQSELDELVQWLNEGKPQPRLAAGILRERFYPSSLEKIWRAVATAEGLASWFCVRAVGEFAPGEIIVLTFNLEKQIEGPVKIVECDAPRSYSFRWHPGMADGCTWDQYPEAETTVVRVSLTPAEGGVHLKVEERDFENVPESRLARVREDNSSGWTEVMLMLDRYLTAG